MKTRLLTALLASLLIFTGMASANASRKNLDPNDTCSEVMRFDGPFDDEMVIFWSFGYLSSITGKLKPVEKTRSKKILSAIKKLCDQNPQQKFGLTVDKLGRLLVKAANNNAPTGPDASDIVKQFLRPGADFARLTAAIKPTMRDVKYVFAEPLASKLVAMYGQVFKPGARIRPKPEHNDYLVTQSTTGKLRSGIDLDKFAGGHKKILKYYRKDIPVARFKFIKSGEKLGLSFDALYYVNGRWVLMPKPWRGLR